MTKYNVSPINYFYKIGIYSEKSESQEKLHFHGQEKEMLNAILLI